MDFDKMDSQEREATASKKKSFRFIDERTSKKYTVRSTYGILQKPCCGCLCRYCPYSNKKGSTKITGSEFYDIEELHNLF